MLVSGPALGITGRHCDDNLLAPEYHERGEGVADGPWAMRELVRRNVKYGVDLIKYCDTGGVFSKGTRLAPSSTQRKRWPHSSTRRTCMAARSPFTRTVPTASRWRCMPALACTRSRGVRHEAGHRLQAVGLLSHRNIAQTVLIRAGWRNPLE